MFMTHEPTAWTYEPAAGLPTVIHLDEALVVVDKPSGLLSVPGRLPQHHDSALLRLMEPYGPLWVVHRLDMDTSGLIAFARTREAAAHLGRQFERHSIAKRYVALVWGRPPSQQGTIALPLRIDWPQRPRQQVDARGGKPSVTHYAWAQGPHPGHGCDAVAQDGAGVGILQGHSRMWLTPVTGRSHQLRVHLSAVGLPIVGDRFYGRPSAEEPGVGRLMLHAQTLELRHPASNQPLRLEAPSAF